MTMGAQTLSGQMQAAGPRRTPTRRARWLTILSVTLLASLYTFPFVQRGWLPYDEGMLAQSAERTLQGEVPHRDFDEPYTGGLTYVNAAAFRLLGARLLSLRIVLFAFYIPFVAVLCSIALRLVRPGPAVLFTLLCVAWSLPNYFAAIPSWYNLFFAVFGIWALVRYWETGKKAYLLLSGGLGGLSVLVKITGLYFVAAGVAALLFAGSASDTEDGHPRRHITPLRWLAILPLAALPFAIVSKRLGVSEFLYFVLPVLAILSTLAVSVSGNRSSGAGDRQLWLDLRLFVSATLLPLVLFAGVYWAQGAIGDLYRGVLVLPLRRLEYASRAPQLTRMLFALPYALLLLVPPLDRHGRHHRLFVAGLSAILLLLLGAMGNNAVYMAVWLSVRALPLFVALAAARALFGRMHGPAGTNPRLRLIFLLAAASAYWGLVQFPYVSMTYLCYVAPLLALAVLSLVADLPSARVHGLVAAFYLAFALGGMNPGYVGIVTAARGAERTFFYRQPPFRFDTPLDARRAGLLVTAGDAKEYQTLVALIQSKARSPFVYAAPDCPEVCFLSGSKNPTPVIFDFLDSHPGAPADLLDGLRRKGVTVAVINRTPTFSPPIGEALRSSLALEFPHVQTVGRFDVRWKQ